MSDKQHLSCISHIRTVLWCECPQGDGSTTHFPPCQQGELLLWALWGFTGTWEQGWKILAHYLLFHTLSKGLSERIDSILSYYYIRIQGFLLGFFEAECSKTLKMIKQEVEGLQMSHVLAGEAARGWNNSIMEQLWHLMLSAFLQPCSCTQQTQQT